MFINLDIYAKIAEAEKDIDEGKGQDAFEALDEIRAELNVALQLHSPEGLRMPKPECNERRASCGASSLTCRSGMKIS